MEKVRLVWVDYGYGMQVIAVCTTARAVAEIVREYCQKLNDDYPSVAHTISDSITKDGNIISDDNILRKMIIDEQQLYIVRRWDNRFDIYLLNISVIETNKNILDANIAAEG